MTPNENVYGNKANWITSQFNIGPVYFPEWDMLREGVTQNKIQLGETLDKSIGYVGLGAESSYSNIISTDSAGHIVVDSKNVTNFFLSYGDLSYRYYIKNNTNDNTWQVETLATDNLNGVLRPIISFTPSKILWWLLITASSVENPEYDYQVIGVRLYQYVQNLNNWRTDFPYIKAVYMVPAFDVSETDTPDRVTTGNSINLSINDMRNVYNKDNFITYTDLSLVPIPAILSAHTTRQGILLRGSREGLADNYCTSTQCAYFLGDENKIIQIPGGYSYAEQFTDDVLAEIIKQAACFCMPFIADVPIPEGYTVNNIPLTDNCVYFGYPDDNGISHGDYTQGADNVNNPVYEWTDTTDSTYDYTKIDDTEYNNRTGFATTFSPVVSFNRMYATDENNIIMAAKALATAISLKPAEIAAQDYSIASFLTNNPIDAIISVKKYPFTALPAASSAVNVQFGNVNYNFVQGFPMTNTVDSLDFIFSADLHNGLTPVFGNTFLDYEPYTHAELIIPYCGTVPICCADYMGHTIKVKMVVDYITGACTAYIMCDNIALQSISGQIGIDVPVSGIQKATLDSQIVNANLQYKAAQLSGTALAAGTMVTTGAALASAATGNMPAAAATAGAAVTGVAKIQQQEITEQLLEYNAKHVQVPFKQLSSSTGVISEVYESRCRLVIYRPVLSPDYNAEKYAKTIGFACLKNGLVKDFTGITYGDINTDGIACTDAEKTMIRNAFATGVII